jgi:hypothetical protein
VLFDFVPESSLYFHEWGGDECKPAEKHNIMKMKMDGGLDATRKRCNKNRISSVTNPTV